MLTLDFFLKKWEKKYPDLKGKNTSLLAQYTNPPKFRHRMENVPNNFNFYNLRSYKATMVICDYRNFQYISTANTKATEIFCNKNIFRHFQYFIKPFYYKFLFSQQTTFCSKKRGGPHQHEQRCQNNPLLYPKRHNRVFALDYFL